MHGSLSKASGFLAVENGVKQACQQAGRVYARNSMDPVGTAILAVSKTWPAAHVHHEAYAYGQRIFGENYVDELLDKAIALPEDCEWHYIGRIQTNKLGRMLALFVPPASSMSRLTVQTIDSEAHATALSNAALKLGYGIHSLRVFVQVNASSETSKGGVSPDMAEALALFVSKECTSLLLCGLMAIGSGDASEFLQMARLRDKVSLQLSQPLLLSMGMSDDFCAAVAAGSNVVRIGSAIFGTRS